MRGKGIGIPTRVKAARRRAGCASALLLLAAAGLRAEEFRLFPSGPASPRQEWSFASRTAKLRLFDLENAEEADGIPDEFGIDALRTGGAAAATEAATPTIRRCVIFQCVNVPVGPVPPAEKVFTTPVLIWTAVTVFGGLAVGIDGPISDGFHHFHFTNEGFFQTWTYGGGADKASHFIATADIAASLVDAYRLNRLTDEQAFGLSFAATLFAGFLVEVGDGLTPYGFSKEDLTADAVGAFSGAFVHAMHLEDTIGFRLGKVPTTIPADVVGGAVFSGINYATEIYTADLKLGGFSRRIGVDPTISRFFLLSFAFLTKGFGFMPELPQRYQQVGVELGLNFPEILKAVGVRDSTWWGDTLLRMADFFRIPFTQIGVYYNFGNQKWYGPGAPNHFY